MIHNIEIPVSEKEGDFLIEDIIEILPNLEISAGLYHAKDHKAFMMVENKASSEQIMSLDQPLEINLNNFEANWGDHEINNTETQIPHKRYRKLIDQLRLEHLNVEEKTKLLKVINENQSVFHVEGDILSHTNLVRHEIRTQDDLPVYQKSYRYPHCHKEEVQTQIAKMIKEGIIRPSISPWNSPIWVVPKKLDATGTKKVENCC